MQYRLLAVAQNSILAQQTSAVWQHQTSIVIAGNFQVLDASVFPKITARGPEHVNWEVR